MLVWVRSGWKEEGKIRDILRSNFYPLISQTEHLLNPSLKQKLANHSLATITRHGELLLLCISPYAEAMCM